jgi:hypothetical protein
MGKVMLSKEQSKALENAQFVSCGNNADIIRWHVTELFDGVRAPLNELSLDTICRALYVGYEVEPDPEVRVLEVFEHAPGVHARQAIMDVLEIYNIQVKGINS